MAMQAAANIEHIISNLHQHADHYDGDLGASLRELAQQISMSHQATPVVEKLFGPDNGLYGNNPNRDADVALLFQELRIPERR